MKLRKSFRIPIGFLAGAIFLWRADPSFRSFVIGALIMMFGECIRFISAGTLIKFEGVTRNGIYAFTRNPLYAGSFLMGIGACVTGRDLIFSAIFLVLFPILYLRVILREESWLVGRHGAGYAAYLNEVPRFVPRRFDIGEVLRGFSLFLAMKNREPRTVLGLFIVLLALAAKLVF